MGRFFILIIIFLIFLFFIIFNIDHKCDISFGFKVYKDIPIYVSALFSFVLGMLFSIPLAISVGRKRKKASQGFKETAKHKGKKNKNADMDTDQTKGGDSPGSDYGKKENSYYGID